MNGRTASVVLGPDLIESVEPAAPSADDPLLVGGLVDLQVNGWAGCDVNAPDVDAETIVELRRKLADEGTGWFVPTVITASRDSIVRSLAAIAEARRQDHATALAIPYIHVEGPTISPLDGPRGAHDLAHVRPGDLGEFAEWQAACDGLVGMVTSSPHESATLAYIAALAERGVRVSLGHTHATPEQIGAAVSAGARFSTHLGNGIAQQIPRHPNAIWRQLADDRLQAGLIADGHHLPPDTLKAMIRAKGARRSFAVSDSVALGGSEPGRYQTPVGGAVELQPGGRLVVAGTDYLAGAARPLAASVDVLRGAGIGLPEAIEMITTIPARVAGLDCSIRPGAPAAVLALAS